MTEAAELVLIQNSSPSDQRAEPTVAESRGAARSEEGRSSFGWRLCRLKLRQIPAL